MRQCDARFGVHPSIIVVRAAMREHRGHPAHHAFLSAGRSYLKKACNTAHGCARDYFVDAAGVVREHAFALALNTDAKARAQKNHA